MRTEEALPLPDGGRLQIALARPDGAAPAGGWPGVVVVHELFGLTDEMRDVGERFAAEGYVAAVPDFFSHGTRVACLARALLDSARGQGGQVVEDIEAVRGWLAALRDVDAQRLAVVGFCMGGGFALLHAAAAPAGVRAASVNYCGVPGERDALERVCPVVASFGGRDLVYGRYAERLERHLSGLGVAHDVKTYAQAGHGFMTPGKPELAKLAFLPMRLGYNAEAAEDAWSRLFAFFDAHVRGAG